MKIRHKVVVAAITAAASLGGVAAHAASPAPQAQAQSTTPAPVAPILAEQQKLERGQVVFDRLAKLSPAKGKQELAKLSKKDSLALAAASQPAHETEVASTVKSVSFSKLPVEQRAVITNQLRAAKTNGKTTNGTLAAREGFDPNKLRCWEWYHRYLVESTLRKDLFASWHVLLWCWYPGRDVFYSTTRDRGGETYVYWWNHEGNSGQGHRPMGWEERRYTKQSFKLITKWGPGSSDRCIQIRGGSADDGSYGQVSVRRNCNLYS